MPEKKHRDLHFNMKAANEVDVQTRRADFQTIRERLEQLAECFASNDTDRPDKLLDIVERKHVLLAAERLFASDPAEQVLLDPGHGFFLSYSTNDEDFARELAANLKAEGVEGFLAPLSITPGSSWPDEIWQAIRSCRVFVLVVTADAIKSKWCLLEIGAALGLKKPIIAAQRHNRKLPDVLKTVQAMKVQTQEQQASLVQQIKKMCFTT